MRRGGWSTNGHGSSQRLCFVEVKISARSILIPMCWLLRWGLGGVTCDLHPKKNAWQQRSALGIEGLRCGRRSPRTRTREQRRSRTFPSSVFPSCARPRSIEARPCVPAGTPRPLQSLCCGTFLPQLACAANRWGFCWSRRRSMVDRGGIIAQHLSIVLKNHRSSKTNPLTPPRRDRQKPRPRHDTPVAAAAAPAKEQQQRRPAEEWTGALRTTA